MGRHSKARYDRSDVDMIFHPEKITDATYKILDERFILRDLVLASWPATQSPTIGKIFKELKDTIVLYSKYSSPETPYGNYPNIEGGGLETATQQLFEKILNIRSQMLKDLEVFDCEERKRIRKQNVYFFISISVAYILLLAFLSKSLRPIDWYDEFIVHLHFLGKILTMIIGYVIVFCAIFLCGIIYMFVERKLSSEENDRQIVSGIIALVATVIVVLVVNSGIHATFGIDPLHSIQNNNERD